ncbi:diguanylate cyclase [Microbacterium sp. ZW T5_45]|uniref:GGDEF domain-containing protein n=1 Tax=Microbacterium sp. ZW T5_45 TaxID=3378080 RepID=UPI003854EFC5
MVVQGIRASDAEDLRWLRIGWLRSIRERTSTFSVVTATLIAYFGVLGVFELFEDDITIFERGLSAATLVVCVGLFLLVALGGVELPRWMGFVLVSLHGAVSVYYLGFSDERQNAIAVFQELPIMAMYFAWFYGARLARSVMLAVIVAVLGAAVIGPFTGPGGLLGPANIFGAGIFTWMCLEAGIFMRHRMLLESHSDELTGALNRRGFEAKVGMEIRRALRHGRPLSVVLLDLDNFKDVNDEAGHAAGDYVLKSVTGQWMSMSRSSDIVGRLGGDEFAMLLPETDADDATTLMRRLRQYANHPWSWGVAQLRQGDTVESLLNRADLAMYDDKRG